MDNKIIHELQDLSYLSWSRIRKSSGTAGSFLKAYDDFDKTKKYYKLSCYDAEKGIVGHECVNEIIADRLLTILGIPHLEYKLINAKIIVNDKEYTSYLCMSEDFKRFGEEKISLETYFQMERANEETMMNFCIRNGWENYIYEMLIIDFLILNRDRHGANVEVLRNKREKTIRLAPLFDHGLSLVLGGLTEEQIRSVNVLEDKPVQCCVGGRSSYENLMLIPKDRVPAINMLRETDLERIMEGLDTILPEVLINKMQEMIWERWKMLESICN